VQYLIIHKIEVTMQLLVKCNFEKKKSLEVIYEYVVC